ncbi:MAG: HupE/UreJ family protein [Pseudomonadota bacterium]
MQTLLFYLQLGFEHISNLAGFDHILFLVVLCAAYSIEQWRNIVILVTAFTVGHSITLALSSVGTVIVPSHIVEFLIPTTILITALHNTLRSSHGVSGPAMTRQYLVALFFGFIHGMGFSNYFRALLMDDASIAGPLFGFNLGIELGQLLVVTVVVGISAVFLKVLNVRHRDWNVFISGAAAGMSLMLMSEARFW